MPGQAPPPKSPADVDDDANEEPVRSSTVVVVTPFASVLVRVVTTPVGVCRVLICTDVPPAGVTDMAVGSVCNCIWRRKLWNGSAPSCWNGSPAKCGPIMPLVGRLDDDDALVNDRNGPADTDREETNDDDDDDRAVDDADDDDPAFAVLCG